MTRICPPPGSNSRYPLGEIVRYEESAGTRGVRTTYRDHNSRAAADTREGRFVVAGRLGGGGLANRIGAARIRRRDRPPSFEWLYRADARAPLLGGDEHGKAPWNIGDLAFASPKMRPKPRCQRHRPRRPAGRSSPRSRVVGRTSLRRDRRLFYGVRGWALSSSAPPPSTSRGRRGCRGAGAVGRREADAPARALAACAGEQERKTVLAMHTLMHTLFASLILLEEGCPPTKKI